MCLNCNCPATNVSCDRHPVTHHHLASILLGVITHLKPLKAWYLGIALRNVIPFSPKNRALQCGFQRGYVKQGKCLCLAPVLRPVWDTAVPESAAMLPSLTCSPQSSSFRLPTPPHPTGTLASPICRSKSAILHHRKRHFSASTPNPTASLPTEQHLDAFSKHSTMTQAVFHFFLR